MNALQVLSFAAKNNILGTLIKTKRNGREIRKYMIDGEQLIVEAWRTEHTF